MRSCCLAGCLSHFVKLSCHHQYCQTSLPRMAQAVSPHLQRDCSCLGFAGRTQEALALMRLLRCRRCLRRLERTKLAGSCCRRAHHCSARELRCHQRVAHSSWLSSRCPCSDCRRCCSHQNFLHQMQTRLAVVPMCCRTGSEWTASKHRAQSWLAGCFDFVVQRIHRLSLHLCSHCCPRIVLHLMAYLLCCQTMTDRMLLACCRRKDCRSLMSPCCRRRRRCLMKLVLCCRCRQREICCSAVRLLCQTTRQSSARCC